MSENNVSKKSKVKIILVSCSVVVMLTVGAGYFLIQKSLKPENIRKILVEFLNESLPGAEARLGNIELGLGTSVKVHLSEFSLKLKDKENFSSEKLFSVKDVLIRIPLWSILTGGGSASFEVATPEIYYNENSKTTNWKLAMGLPAPIEKLSDEKSEDSGASSPASPTFSVPKLFEKSSLDFKLAEMKLFYSLKDKSQGKILINKLLLKNLGLSSSTAFEVDTNIDSKINPVQKLKFNLLVIGQASLKEFVQEKKLASTIIVKMNEVKLIPSHYQIPDLTTNLNVTLNPDSSVDGNLQSEFLSNNKMSFKFQLDNSGNIAVQNLALDLLISDLMSIASVKDMNIKARESRFNLEGEFQITKSGEINPNLSLKISPDIDIDLTTPIPTTLKSSASGSLRGKKLDFNSLTKVWGGSIDVNAKGDFALGGNAQGPQTIKTVNAIVRIADLKITKDIIQKIMYPPVQVLADDSESVDSSNSVEQAGGATSDEKNNIKNSLPNSQVAQNSMLPAVNVTLDIARLKIDNEDFSGQGKMTYTSKKSALENFNFRFSSGSGSLSHSTNTTNPLNLYSVFKMNIAKVNMKGFSAFLPPFLKGIEGTFSGNIFGATNQTPKKMSYSVNAKVSALQGKINGLDLTDKLSGLIQSVPVLKDKASGKPIVVDGNFETFIFDGELKDSHYNIQKFQFVGVDKKIEMNGQGSVYPTGQSDADLYMDLLDHSGKIADILEKNVGQRVLPIHFIGKGFDLKPDYAYTLEKFAKSALKTKLKSKIEEKAGDKIKDILGDKLKNNEGVNKLLKGFFK